MIISEMVFFKSDLRIFGFVFFLVISTSVGFSQSISVEKRLDFWNEIGQNVFAKFDFDEDGENEFIADVNGGKGVIIGKIKNGLLKTIHESFSTSDVEFYKFFYVDSDADEKELYGIARGNIIYRFSLPDLNIVDTFVTGLSPDYVIKDIIFSDHDQDGTFNWIVISSNLGAYLLNAVNFEIEGTFGNNLNGTDISIRNFDMDVENEIFILTPSTSTLLNLSDFSVERSFDGVFDFKAVDFNHDGIFQILYLDDNHVLGHYDHSVGDTTFSMIFDDFNPSRLFVGDLNNDNQEEIVAYTNYIYQAAILTTNPFEISQFPETNDANFFLGGRILDVDDYFLPDSSAILLFGNTLSGNTFVSVDYENRKPLARTYNIYQPAIEIFDHLWSEEEMSMGVNRMSDSSPASSEEIFFMNYDSFEVARTISPDSFFPEYFTSFDANWEKFRTRGQRTFDMVMTEIFYDDFLFYNPLLDDQYNEGYFKPDYFSVDDLDYDGNPELITLNRFDEVIIVNEFSNAETFEETLSLFSPGQTTKYWICQADADKQKEIIIPLAGGQISIFDSETAMPFNLPLSASQLSAYPGSDGNFNLFGVRNGSFFIYDIDQQSLIVDVNVDARYVKHIPIHIGGSIVNYFVTFNDQLKLISETGSIIALSEKFPQSVNYKPDIFVHDTDNDGDPNILTSYKNGILDFEINLSGDFYQPFHLTDSYPSDNSLQDRKSSVLLEFNHAVEPQELIENVSIVSRLTGDIIPFTVEETSVFFYELKPTLTFFSGDTIDVIVSNKLESKGFRHLDGNFNEVVDDNDTDDFHFSFLISDTMAVEKPEIFWVDEVIDTIYVDNKRYAKFQIQDTNNTPVQIKSCYAGFMEDFLNGTQQLFLPKDSVFNNSTEVVSVLFNTFGKVPENYEFYVIASNYLGIESDTLKIPVVIITEKGSPYKRDGVNEFNTFSQQNDTVKSAFELIQYFYFPENSWGSENRVVGEGDYLYTSREHLFPHYFHKININTGEVVWEKEISVGIDIANPVLDRGNLYFQTSGFGTTGKELAAISAVDGTLLWKAHFRNQHLEKYSPVIVDDYLLMKGGKYGGLYCFDRWTGRELWFKKMHPSLNWTPSVYDGVVYGIGEEKIKGFKLATGELLAEFDLPWGNNNNNINSSMIVDTISNSIFYKNNSDLFAFNLDTHLLNWSLSPGASHFGLIGNKLFVNTFGKLICLDPVTGETLYEKHLDSGAYTDMLVSGGKIFLSGQNIDVYDTETFELLWTIEGVYGLISIINDKLVVSRKEHLWLFDSVDECFANYNVIDTICSGDIYTFHGNEFDVTTSFQDTVFYELKCNEIWNLDLMVDSIMLGDTVITDDTGSGNGTISVSFSEGLEPFSYLWSTGDTTEVIQDLLHGMYYLTVTDNFGCEKQYSFEVDFVLNTNFSDFSKIEIFPNPIQKGSYAFISQLNLMPSIQNIVIRNVFGQPLVRENNINTSQVLKIPINLETGVFFVEFYSKNNNLIGVKKIVVSG